MPTAGAPELPLVCEHFLLPLIESRRVFRRKKHAWTLRDRRLRYALDLALAYGLVAALFGGTGIFFFLAQSLVAICLLELINYIEHYGLTRKMKPNGRYERVQPIHSWNSNHALGRLLLFELSRHSDHHANPTRSFQLLRHFDESPQFPTGYPAMIVLAWFPPLWFAVMNPKIEDWKQQFCEA